MILTQAPCSRGSLALAVFNERDSETAIHERLDAAQSASNWWPAVAVQPSSLLLPPEMKGAPFALITPTRPSPAAKELALPRTLRNQGVMAFRQAGRLGGRARGRG